MKPAIFSIAAIVALTGGLAANSHAEDEELKACAAKDIKAGRSFIPTGSQLKAFVDATAEVYRLAKSDKAIASFLASSKDAPAFSCRVDDTETAMNLDNAQKLLGQNSRVAKVYSQHNVSARDLSLLSFIIVPLAVSTDPKYNATVQSDLSPQQIAVAKQYAGELQRFLKLGSPQN